MVIGIIYYYIILNHISSIPHFITIYFFIVRKKKLDKLIKNITKLIFLASSTVAIP